MMRAAVQPVSITEFSSAVQRIWQRHSRTPARKIGLAISGGVDSMALANLVAKSWPDLSVSEPIAFVVDHKIRPESTDEAQKVKATLQSMGIATEVLTGTADSWANEHIESSARMMRYNLLGEACRKHGIDTLMVAHHAGDQAETVLIRILNRYLGWGLRAIKEFTALPGCYGTYGIHGSGQPRRLRPEFLYWGKNINDSSPDTNILVESGGIHLMRPLLTFTKDQLITTCSNDGIPWFEDQTNADITLATRNAVRYLQASAVLPQALDVSRLSRVATELQKQRAEDDRYVDMLFETADVQFSAAYGQLRCDFPQESIEALQYVPNADLVRSRLMTKLVDMVAPINASLASVRRFSEHFLTQASKTAVAYTCANVAVQSWQDDDGTYCYRFTRQNPGDQSGGNHIAVTVTDQAGDDMTRWSPWHLFDNRYWIRLGHIQTVSALPGKTKIRFRQVSDSLDTKHRDAHIRYREMARNLEAVDRFRQNAPVISVDGHMVAMPSMGIVYDDQWSNVRRKSTSPAKYLYDIRYRALPLHFSEPLEAD